MLTREPHPRTLRKNRAVWHCRLALDHRRACLFDPLVPGQRRIRYHVHASDVFKLPRIPPARWVAILSQKRAAVVSGGTCSMYGRTLVSLLQWHEDLDRVVVIADAAHEQRALHAIVSFGLAPRASPPVKTHGRTP
jgi:hypothetical protein